MLACLSASAFFFNYCFSLFRTLSVVVFFLYIPRGEFSQWVFLTIFVFAMVLDDVHLIQRFCGKEQDKDNILTTHQQKQMNFLSLHFSLRSISYFETEKETKLLLMQETFYTGLFTSSSIPISTITKCTLQELARFGTQCVCMSWVSVFVYTFYFIQLVV